MPLVADHPAERVGQRNAQHEDQQHLHQAGEGGRVLERMRRIGVEEAAAIAAHHRDHLLRGDRAERNHLLYALKRRGCDIGAKGLRHALPDHDQRRHEANRQQHVQCDPREIDPEVADGLCRPARETPHQGERHGNSHRRRHERLHHDSRHLRQIAERRLAAV